MRLFQSNLPHNITQHWGRLLGPQYHLSDNFQWLQLWKFCGKLRQRIHNCSQCGIRNWLYKLSLHNQFKCTISGWSVHCAKTANLCDDSAQSNCKCNHPTFSKLHCMRFIVLAGCSSDLGGLVRNRGFYISLIFIKASGCWNCVQNKIKFIQCSIDIQYDWSRHVQTKYAHICVLNNLSSQVFELFQLIDFGWREQSNQNHSHMLILLWSYSEFSRSSVLYWFGSFEQLFRKFPRQLWPYHQFLRNNLYRNGWLDDRWYQLSSRLQLRRNWSLLQSDHCLHQPVQNRLLVVSQIKLPWLYFP